MTTEILAKLNKLENVQIGMQAELKTVSQVMERMAKTSEQIVELRTEYLHIIKSCDRSERAHDEIFNRLRDIETWKGSVETKTKNICNHVNALQKNQRWVALTVIGALIVGFIGLGFNITRYEMLSSRQPMFTNKGAPHGQY